MHILESLHLLSSQTFASGVQASIQNYPQVFAGISMKGETQIM